VKAEEKLAAKENQDKSGREISRKKAQKSQKKTKTKRQEKDQMNEFLSFSFL
jgi:hypothetical protein